MSMVAYQNLTRWLLLGVLALMLLGGRLAFAGQSLADVSAMLKAMADPAGAPFFPVVMQILQVLTWALHIVFVWTSIGGLFYAIYGFTRKDPNHQRLAKAMLELSKVSVSLAIVLGVAPLLFYQVIYDPLWYASANLSASWYIMFIVSLLIGYYLIWGAYFTRMKPQIATLFSIGGVIFLLLVGFIIHVVNYQALYPEKWVEWYTSGGTTMNHTGWGIYAFNIFRYLAFLVFPAISVIGVFMMLYAWYFGKRPEFERDYVNFSAKLGAKLALMGGAGWIVFHVLYIFSVPADWNAKGSIFAWLSVLGLLLCAGVIFIAQKNPIGMAIPSLVAGTVATLLIAVFREYLRVASTVRFGYSIYEYKVNLEWLSPMLFLGTTLTGLILYAYAWWMAYKAGRTPKGEVYQASETEHHLGEVSVFIVILWAIVFVGTGLIIIARNYI
ncbi:hypothetical protein [Pampinifervens florentissimum]|uniref:hypothetical protein n=1 Tax=Pampinifervens florentissimum TaxID=1632019 RepID=UPI0020C23232|nr:hypothetical protein [Hydrogenobacter sp. T-8]